MPHHFGSATEMTFSQLSAILLEYQVLPILACSPLCQHPQRHKQDTHTNTIPDNHTLCSLRVDHFSHRPEWTPRNRTQIYCWQLDDHAKKTRIQHQTKPSVTTIEQVHQWTSLSISVWQFQASSWGWYFHWQPAPFVIMVLYHTCTCAHATWCKTHWRPMHGSHEDDLLGKLRRCFFSLHRPCT